MLISKAYAQTTESAEIALAEAPSTTEALISTIGLPILLVILFYILLIAPQQRRFKQHSAMLNELKKGDKVVTGGGLVGKIDKIIDDKEVVVDLGSGQKVTALRSTIQGKSEAVLKPANDAKPEKNKAKDKNEEKAKPKPKKSDASGKSTKKK
jgi:preprotein translocase subunit YajC